VAYTTDPLRRLAIEIVAECQPCSPYVLLGRLREEGASHAAANTTICGLIAPP